MHFHPITILLGKKILDAELLTIFMKGLIWLFRFWGVPTLEVTTRGSFKFFKNFLQGLVPEMLPFPMIYNSYIVLHYFIPYSAF
jgi:isoprenylcysteine carboxyl methyltransferase (ICMT) family protein YpbQ